VGAAPIGFSTSTPPLVESAAIVIIIKSKNLMFYVCMGNCQPNFHGRWQMHDHLRPKETS
jgi:hypothetical protein